MKAVKLIASVILISSITIVNAQKITDGDLQRYIIAIDSIETLKNQLTEKMNALAKGNEKVSAKRYTELIGKADDMAKLGEAKATPDEIGYVKRASMIQQEETRKFQKAYQSLISDYVGDSTFGKIRHALTIDTVLKEKHDLLLRERKN